jgi:hypothetical protein
MWESFSTDRTDPRVFFCLLVWDFRPFCASVDLDFRPFCVSVHLLLDNRAPRFQRSRSSLMEVAILEVASQDALPRHPRCQWHNGKTCSPRTFFTKDKNKFFGKPKGNYFGPFMTSNFLGCLQDLFLFKFLLMMLLIMPISFYEHENESYV